MRSHSLTCPADGGRAPAVEGVEAVDGKWRLSVVAHEDLLRTITGVDPRDELDLQELATITTRLEGYVEQRKRVAPRSETERDGSDGESLIASTVGGLVSRLRVLLTAAWGVLSGHVSETHPRQSTDVEQYDVETVYELSRFFRVALEARRRAVTVESSSRVGSAAAD